MVISSFPPLHAADETGLIAIGGDLRVDSLLLAYRSGIFPWPVDEHILTWFSPPMRTVLFLNEFHPSKSLVKAARRGEFTVKFDTAFREVIEACAKSKNRPGQRGTWITREIVDAYIEFHKAGYAHSIESFKDDSLAGGLYGVAIGGMFAGESMFFRQPNASKVALFHLVEHLRERGVEWIDCQAPTPLFEGFGARDIPREEYIQLLQTALARKVTLIP